MTSRRPSASDRVRAAGSVIVRVLPDIPGLDKTFDYTVPDELADRVGIGTIVRVELQGRRVGGWVVDRDVVPPAGVAVRPIAKVTGHGPSRDLVDLASWAAWRWAGRMSAGLTSASPPRAVPVLSHMSAPRTSSVAVDDLARHAFESDRTVVRLPPATDPIGLVLGAAALGPALAVTHSVPGAR